ncbi:MAG TPA: PHP domain-containing protein [Mariniphaga sp.]|nr:PHP domain-containing protein [Mariniphaga sp.]
MKKFRADIHIHTLLSPCASLEMTPRRIVQKAKAGGINIIGITDHNSTKNALLVKKIAEDAGIFTLTGAEITTREEVHCLVFFEYPGELMTFQKFIDEHITYIPNKGGFFGDQPVIDANENIVELVPYYLPAALKAGITETQQQVEKLNGLFIPAHIDRQANGIIAQLGFIPSNLKFDALGISSAVSEKYVVEQYVIQYKTTIIRNSDAHYLKQIGDIYTVFLMEDVSFSEIRKALNRQDNRYCELV